MPVPETIAIPARVPSRAAPAPARKPARMAHVDAVRGLAVALMALDHVRSFFHSQAAIFEPTDLTQTTPAIFLTRWVTHLCAPLFVLLAGTSAFFSRDRGKSPAELSWFLRSRGAWLIVVELTIVKFGWTFSLSPSSFTVQVIWALGWAMIGLSFLVSRPAESILKAGVGTLLVYALLLEVPPDMLGAATPLWEVAISGGGFDIGTFTHVSVKYPLIPWAALMAIGYGIGPVLVKDRALRRRRLVWAGTVVTAVFLSLRWLETGGWSAWLPEGASAFDLLWLMDAEKYPPSLTFFAMTVGPSLLILAAWDRSSGSAGNVLVTFGRVPFFFYVMHLPLIHLLASIASHFDRPDRMILPARDWKYALPFVYLLWFAVLALMYPASKWFADLKRRRSDRWLSYL